MIARFRHRLDGFVPRLRVDSDRESSFHRKLDAENSVLYWRPFLCSVKSCCSHQRKFLECSRYTKGQCSTLTSWPKVIVYVSRIELFSSTVTVSVIVFPSVRPV